MRWERLKPEQVAREDVVMFINACFACTSQKEFYGSSAEQAVSIAFLHRYILGNYRRLYALCLAAGINHFNQVEVILSLLETGRDTTLEQRRWEGALIGAALRKLPPQRAYRAISKIRDRGINNRRTRAIVRDYLAWRRDPVFDAVKYRRHVRAATVHNHLRLGDEREVFLFSGWTDRTFKTPLFETFRQAHYAQEAVYQLPFTVAEGLAAKHGIPRKTFLARIEDKMTAGEKLRLQKTAARTRGVSLDIDLTRQPLTRLALYFLSRVRDHSMEMAAREKRQRNEREIERARWEEAFAKAAQRAAGQTHLKLGRVALVLDRSFSSSGSSEKRRRPLAIALAIYFLVRAAAQEMRPFWTMPTPDLFRLTPQGQTDLATPLLDALAWEPDTVLIVSDSYDNDPPGAASEVLRIFRQKLDPKRRVEIVHLNPVFDAEHFAPRPLSPCVPTLGLRDAEDLATMLHVARFADNHAAFDKLESYLSLQATQLLASKGMSVK